MKACMTASVVAFVTLVGVIAVGACREAPSAPPAAEARPESSGMAGASGPSAPTAEDGGRFAAAVEEALQAGTFRVTASGPPLVGIRDLPVRVEMAPCTDAAIAVVDGSATALDEELGAGDVFFAREGGAFDVKGSGTIVLAQTTAPALCPGKRAASREVVRLAANPELTWAKGTMHARLQLGKKEQADFYLGRLEGTAAVAEHAHAGTWEILAAIEGAGTFVIDGKEARLGPRQLVRVPPDTKHAWRPDPGSRLRAVQLYFPPGPEQRFVALAAAEQDAGGAARPGK